MRNPVIYFDDRSGRKFSIENAPFDAKIMTDPAAESARILSLGYPIGLISGRSEFGPRALGGRCILADPRPKNMTTYLNDRIKHREWFRPYAPIVPLERAGDFFELECESPYMLLVVKIRKEWKEKISGVVHVDGSARVQTVTRDQDPFLCDLLIAFEQITGIPILILTSFNDHGDPIVETPLDAFSCFASTDLPYLALGNRLLSKRLLPEPCRG